MRRSLKRGVDPPEEGDQIDEGVDVPVPVATKGKNDDQNSTDRTEPFPNTNRSESEESSDNFETDPPEDSPAANPKNRRQRTRTASFGIEEMREHMKVGQIPTSDDEDRIVTEHYGADSWQLKVLHVVHSKPVQTTLMLMLLFDVCVLFAELYLQAEFPSCSIISRDAISCCPKSDDYAADGYGGDKAYGDDGDHRFLGGGGGDYICADPKTEEVAYQAGCDGHKYPELHTAHLALFGITIAILGSFMIELTLLIICLSPCVFFSYMFYIVDFLVVTISFALEVTFHIVSKENLGAAVGLLVVIRLWRFARIGHGLVKAATETQSAKHKKVVAKLEALLEEHNIPFESNLEDQFTKRAKSLRNLSHGSSKH